MELNSVPQSGMDVACFLEDPRMGGWFLASVSAYTVTGPRVQGGSGRSRKLLATGAIAACLQGNSSSLGVSALGCPLPDDRVALTQRVKEANDIVDVVGSYIALRPAGPTFKGVCPFHDDHRPSFDVDPRRQRFRCWACNKYGDVITFVQEFVHVGFQEALEMLAQRAGISLDSVKKSPHATGRALMLDVARWAGEQFQECLLESPLAEAARQYLGERQLLGETVRRFGLGFAPPSGDWLVNKARSAAGAAQLSLENLELVGLVARRKEGAGYYDRFRDRVIFPIRDPRGQTVGFGGRILRSSPLAAKAPKYYNSSETPLFSKSDQLYGIDQARQAAVKAGYLAIVEGYTDVLMAHQHGIQHVVATMGTALNERHIRKIRGWVPRVVLVFDADAGGEGGVDRALELFVRSEMDLRIATLPEGLDPCDLLVAQGPEPLLAALEAAADVLEFKLARVMTDSVAIEERRQGVERMLQTLALAPELRNVKVELMVNRIAHRLTLKEETVWKRLEEVHASRRSAARESAARESARPEEAAGARQPDAPARGPAAEPERQAPAAKHEIELLEALLADGALVGQAIEQVAPAELEHPGLRLLLEGLYRLHAEGRQPDLDHLRGRLDNEKLLTKAEELRQRGLAQMDRQAYLNEILARIQERRQLRQRLELKSQVLAAPDHGTARKLLEKLTK
jgi:DNA primase